MLKSSEDVDGDTRGKENPAFQEDDLPDQPGLNYYPGREAQPEEEKQPDVPQVKVYWTRWYILAVFCVLSGHQNTIWNSWGPIASSVQIAYGWSDATVAMMANWGSIIFPVATVPLSWMLEKKGLRPTMITVCLFVTVGAVLRLSLFFTSDPTVFLVSCHLCAILNGIAGVTMMAAPPYISSLWFPAGERTTATGINVGANIVGAGFAMVVGPAMVKYRRPAAGSNSSFAPMVFRPQSLGGGSCGNWTVEDGSEANLPVDEIKREIGMYMAYQAAVAILVLVTVLLYYPSRPPLPPTPTSAIQRMEFMSSIRALFRNRDAMLTIISCMLSQGIMGAWAGVMVLDLRPLGLTDQQVGFIGLAMVVSSAVGINLVGFFTDRLRTRMKLTIIALLAASALGFVWFLLTTLRVVSYTLPTLYLSLLIPSTGLAATIPLFLELSTEIAYPVHEGWVAGVLTCGLNLVAMVFLFIFFIPNIGYNWMNFVLLASSVSTIPIMFFVKETYNRSAVDNQYARMEE